MLVKMSFRITNEHWEVMLTFLESNKEVAHGRFNGPKGRERSKKLWTELAMQLNALGSGERSADKWQKTWIDFKYLLKKKGSNLRRDQLGTGGGPLTTSSFNKFELRALNILGDSFFQGVGAAEVAVVADVNHTDNIEKVPFRSENDGDLLIRKKSITVTENQSEQIDLSTPKNNKDHDYTYTPSVKKRKVGDVEEAYQETINILRDIKNVIDMRMGQIVDRLDKLISNAPGE